MTCKHDIPLTECAFCHPDTPMLRKRLMFLDNGTTVADLVARLTAQGLDPVKVRIHGGSLRFQTPETPEELAERIKHTAEADARREVWEHRTYLRLKAKYEGGEAS